MVRKIQFNRQDVIDAAFLVVRKKGIEHLTARSVAQELEASTAPVYSNFESMEELGKAVFAKAADKLREYAVRPHTENHFLNIGIGVLRYAWDCPLWYFAFSVRSDLAHEHLERLRAGFLDQMNGIPEMAPIHFREKELLLHKMAIFTHGMAWDICLGNVPQEDIEVGVRLMEEVGTVLVQDALTRPARTEEEYRTLAHFCHAAGRKPEPMGEDS